MRARFLLFASIVFVIAVACSAPPTAGPPTAAPPAAVRSSAAPVMQTVVVAATKAPELAQAPVPPGATPAVVASNSNIPAVVAQRKIIKNAEFQMTVENAAIAVDRLTGITGEMGGYTLSVKTFYQSGIKSATVAFAVPVDRFEDALRRVRTIALKVELENASGQDVTDQFVDLESHLRNLEATADRIREFLKKAQSVEEALKVNQQLAAVEKEIETVKGKMNYIEGRAAFSTITVDLHEPMPTPTVTSTPTATPTVTPTATPIGWHPDETFRGAVNAQKGLLQFLIDLAIWLVVVLLPYALVFLAVAWGIVRFVGWMNKSRSRRTTPPSSGPESTK